MPGVLPGTGDRTGTGERAWNGRSRCPRARGHESPAIRLGRVSQILSLLRGRLRRPRSTRHTLVPPSDQAATGLGFAAAFSLAARTATSISCTLGLLHLNVTMIAATAPRAAPKKKPRAQW